MCVIYIPIEDKNWWSNGNNKLAAFLNESQEIQKTPVAILDQQLVKRFNKDGTKILVQWSNSYPEEATWEFYDMLQNQFPESCSKNS